MRQAVAQRLQALAIQTQNIDQESKYKQWRDQTRAFLETSLGHYHALAFSSFDTLDWASSLAMQRGHLEALARTYRSPI